jgi:hypothetical protein
LRRRSALKGLGEFVGVQPSYWLHLRIYGRGVRLSESFIAGFFGDLGYQCAEWVGDVESENRLGIFHSPISRRLESFFCLDIGRFTRKFDLLLPVRNRWRFYAAYKVKAKGGLLT